MPSLLKLQDTEDFLAASLTSAITMGYRKRAIIGFARQGFSRQKTAKYRTHEQNTTTSLQVPTVTPCNHE